MSDATTVTPDKPPRRRRVRILRTFLAGLLAALPLLATLSLLVFAFRFLVSWVGPDSLFGRLLRWMGVGIYGSDLIAYLVGLGAALVLIFLLGILVERGLSAWLTGMVESFVSRIPIVRTIYDTVGKFVGILSQRDENRLKTMRPVWCHFGGRGGVSALALLSSPDPILVDGRLCYALIVPTAPVPIGGGLLFAPVDWITPAEIGMEGLTSIYVSMGVTSPQFLPTQKSAAAGR